MNYHNVSITDHLGYKHQATVCERKCTGEAAVNIVCYETVVHVPMGYFVYNKCFKGYQLLFTFFKPSPFCNNNETQGLPNS